MLKDRDSVLWDTSLVQPYASIWSVWLHFLYINVDIYSDLFGRRGLFPDQIKSGKGTAYNRYGLEGLSAGLEEWIHDFLEVDETSAVPRFRSYTRSDEGFSTGSRSLMDGFVHICPECARYGYHSYLHQVRFLKNCFIHRDTELVRTDHKYSIIKGNSYDRFMEEHGFGNCFELMRTKENLIVSMPVLKDLSYMEKAVLFVPGTRDISYIAARFMDFLAGKDDGQMICCLDNGRSETNRERFVHSLLENATGKARDLLVKEKDLMPALVKGNAAEYLMEHALFHKVIEGLSDKQVLEIYRLFDGNTDVTASPFTDDPVFRRAYMKVCLLTKFSTSNSPYDMETSRFVFSSGDSRIHTDMLPDNVNVQFPYTGPCTLISDIAKKRVLDLALAGLERYMDSHDVDISAYNRHNSDWSFLDLPLYIIYTAEDKVWLLEI